METIIWDKGIAHIAGNVNGATIRRFPVASEICAFYQRRPEFLVGDQMMHLKNWMLSEWQRTGLPLKKTNEACGVKDAATRKYFDQGHLWYPPPPEKWERLVAYANEHGDPAGRPYFSSGDQLDSRAGADGWQRYTWTHQHGFTNIWSIPPLHGTERLKHGSTVLHLNQKPLELMRRILTSATQEGDVIWEPFGGLCSASYAAREMGRVPYCAENNETYAELAQERLNALDVLERKSVRRKN